MKTATAEAQSPADEQVFVRHLAKSLGISVEAARETFRRGMVHPAQRYEAECWRFGDDRNGCFRRLDGQWFNLRGKFAKCLSEKRGPAWHRLIGLDDVVRHDRRDVLLFIEGSKDGMAGFHFAHREGRLSTIGITVAQGTGFTVLQEDLEKFRGRRVRIIADTDSGGDEAAPRVARSFAGVTAETQILSLSNLCQHNGTSVKDLFDLLRLDPSEFERNPDLRSITNLDANGDRITVTGSPPEFFSSPPPPRRGGPEVPVHREDPVHPVSEESGLIERLTELAERNRCDQAETGRKRRFKLLRDLAAIELVMGRKLTPDERKHAFETWYQTSRSHLDPSKSHDHYLTLFLAERRKVRIPTGSKGALETALKNVSALAKTELPNLPSVPDPPECLRTLAALHWELSKLSANGTYFLSSRDAAKVHPDFNKDSARAANLLLAEIRVVEIVRVGEARPGGDATEFRYLLPR